MVVYVQIATGVYQRWRGVCVCGVALWIRFSAAHVRVGLHSLAPATRVFVLSVTGWCLEGCEPWWQSYGELISRIIEIIWRRSSDVAILKFANAARLIFTYRSTHVNLCCEVYKTWDAEPIRHYHCVCTIRHDRPTIRDLNPLTLTVAHSSRIHFKVFFKIQKRDFLRFLKCHVKKVKT